MNQATPFFAALGLYLEGRSSLASVEAELGPSPSGSVRMEFYRRLMVANRRRILKHVFPTLAAIFAEPERAGLMELPSWSDLSESFARAHPPSSWDPNDFGRHLPAWLAASPLPEALSHIADWSWRLLAAARAPDPGGPGLHPSVSAVAYPFDLPAWVARFERREPVRSLAAIADPGVLVVVFRDPETLRPKYLRPTPVELLALGSTAGERFDDAVDPSALNLAISRLTTLGLIVASGRS